MYRKLAFLIICLTPCISFAGVHVMQGDAFTGSSITITGAGIRLPDGTVFTSTTSFASTGGVSVFPASATASFPYGFSVSTISTTGTGAGQMDFTEGVHTGVVGVATGHDVCWADSTFNRLRCNFNGSVSTYTLVAATTTATPGNYAVFGNSGYDLVNGGIAGTLGVSVYPATATIQGNYGINTTTAAITDISTMTVNLAYFDATGGHFGMPTRTSAQIALLQPLFAGAGNIIRCSDCASGKVCIDTGTVAGAWGIIQSTGVACR